MLSMISTLTVVDHDLRPGGRITYFMTDGLQKTVGPENTSERTLILDPES